MSYVIDYTIIAGGLPYQGKGTDHADALNRFIDKPRLQYGYRRGRYTCQDGEQIAVVGPTQESFRERSYWQSSKYRAELDVAKGGKGIREAQKRLRALLERGEPEVPIVTLTFLMRAFTVFEALTPETVALMDGDPGIREKFAEIAGDGCENRVRLHVRCERMTPVENATVGVPETADDDGVWMNGYLVPWMDIQDVTAEPLPEPVEA